MILLVTLLVPVSAVFFNDCYFFSFLLSAIAEPLAGAHGTCGIHGTPVENHWSMPPFPFGRAITPAFGDDNSHVLLSQNAHFNCTNLIPQRYISVHDSKLCAGLHG